MLTDYDRIKFLVLSYIFKSLLAICNYKLLTAVKDDF